MQRKGSLFGLGSGLFWGLDSVMLGIALMFTTMLSLGAKGSLIATFIHDGASFIFLILLLLKMKKTEEFKRVLFSKAGLAIIAAALLGGPIGMGAYILSINYMGAGLAASISAIYPAIGALLAYIFLKERLKKHSIFGLFLAISAISLMGFSSGIDISNLSLGLFFLLICVVGWGSEAVIINAALKEDVSSEVALTIRQFTSFVVYLFIIIPIVGYKNVSHVLGEPNLILLIVVTGLAGTISYLFYYKSIDLIGATQAMGLNISYPAWAFLFQFMIDGKINVIHLFLVILIMIGSILSNDDPKLFLSFMKKKR